MSSASRQFSRLLIDQSRFGTSGRDLDKMLQKLLPALGAFFGGKLLDRGVLLLCGKNGRLCPAAQHGLAMRFEPPRLWSPSIRKTSFPVDIQTTDWSSLFDTPPPEAWHGQLLVLPLVDGDDRLGMLLILAAEGWQPAGEHLENLGDLARVATSVVQRCLASETLQLREKELEDARIDAIHRLGTASEYRDNETGMHLVRMTQFAGAIGKALGLAANELELLRIVAPMHDVGKIGIQDAILLKPGRLTPDEFVQMKRHTEIGGQLLAGEDALIVAARQVAECHHEHWDGGGYPRGLKGAAIPLHARICAVADVFDALTTTRPYKAPWAVDDAVEWIRRQSGKQFDPAVVEAFEAAMPMILRIRDLYSDQIIDPRQAVELPEPEPSDADFITWEDGLSVGIDLIDLHHLYLVDLINSLHDVIARKQGARKVAVLLQSLGAYARVHFEAEERMMAHYGYAGLTRQQASHRGFERQVRDFGQALHANPLTAQLEVLEFLRGWLLNHIRHEDAGLRQLASPPAQDAASPASCQRRFFGLAVPAACQA